MAARKAGSSGKRPGGGGLAPLSKRLISAFSRVTEDLEALDAKYAVIGGLAVGLRVEPRTTRDIDFAVYVPSDAEAEALVFALSGRGYTVASVFQRRDGRIATVRTYGRQRILIDYLFTSTLIEHEIVAAATREDMHGVEAPVAQLGHLLAMKIKANRDHDSIDIHNLVERATAADLRKAEAALQLMQARGVDPKRDLVAEMRRRVAVVRRRDPDLTPVTGARLKKFKRRRR